MKQNVSKKTKIRKESNNSRYSPVEFDLHVGSIVREQLAFKGVSQIALAKQLGITAVAVQNKLNNPLYGSVYDLIKTSNFINIDLFKNIRLTLVNLGNGLYKSSEDQLLDKIADLEIKLENAKKEKELLKQLAGLNQKHNK